MSTLVKHSSFYLASRGLGGVFSYATLALFTRLLKPEEYGLFSLVTTGVGFANVLLFQWLQMGLMRFFPSHHEKPEALLSTIVKIFVALIPATALMAGAAVLANPDPKWIATIALGTGLLWCQAWFNLNLTFARSSLKPRRYTFLSGMEAAVSLAAGGCLAASGLGASGAIFGLMIGTTAACVVSFRDWRGVRLGLGDRALAKSFLSYGVPLTASATLAMIIGLSDRFMIQTMLGEQQVGLYAVGYDLAQQTLGGLVKVMGLAATPLAMWALQHKGMEAARRQYAQSGKLILAVMLPAAAGIYAVGDELIELTLGREFRETAATVFPWIVAAAFLQGIKTSYLDSAFYLNKRTGLLLSTIVPATLLNVGLNIFWIPRYGVMGAAYSTLASYGLAFGATLWIAAKVLVMPLPWKVTAQAGLASGVMVAVIFWMKRVVGDNLLLLVASGFVVYGACAVVADIGPTRQWLAKWIGTFNRKSGRGES